MAAIIGNRNITLGVLGNRLITACAGFGGDVFGCSPYDAATTAYLKATYPLHWQAIRNFGLDNPSLVPFVNEDNDLIVSLVSVGKERWLVGDGSSYLYVNIKPSNTTKFKTKMKVNGGSEFYFGGRNSYGNSMFAFHPGYAQFGSDTGSMTTIPTSDRNVHIVELSQDGYILDGVKKKSYSTQTFTSPNYFAFFNCLQGSGTPYSGSARCQFAYGDFYEEGKFVPFKRNGQMELLDIVTGTLATRVGTFTELID